jgi:hypothetical protein
MENNMKHTLKNSITENMHGLLESIFVDYANQLRAKYPDRIIRNAAVFASGVPEFARLGFIELVDARRGIPEGIPDFLVRTIKRAKHQPIWIPGVNFPDDPWDINEQMKPSMRDNEVTRRFRKARAPMRDQPTDLALDQRPPLAFLLRQPSGSQQTPR